MKGKRALLLALLIAFHLLLTPFTVSVRAAPQQQPESSTGESNNSFGTATSFIAGVAVQETLAPSGDVDWFALTVEQQGELQISITNSATDLAINVRVWNANKETISNWFAPLAAGGDTSAVVDLAEPGRYFLEVTDRAGSVDSVQPYELQTTFTATADTAEPNNSFGSAASLAFDQPQQANILPTGDVDWYRLEAPSHGELSVQITDVASDLAVSLRLWNSNKETQNAWVSPLAIGGDTSAILDLPEAGIYYLEVTGDGAQRSTQPYTLVLTFVPAADALEPNNTFGSAAPLAFGETILANILPKNDVDWYRVEVDHHGELSVAVTDVPETLAIRFRVWNGNKETVSNWISPLAAGGDTSGLVDLPAPGTYYLEFSEAGATRSVEPFSVTVSFTRAVDPFEANNTFGTASNLGLHQAVQTNILPQGETDWHLIDVDHQGELEIIASNVPENLDIRFRVWNNNKETISNWMAPLAHGGDTTGRIDLPTAGQYYVEVADGGGDARSIEPFTFLARFAPTADQGEPNDSLQVATPVNLDTTIAGNILPANDADWCRIEIATTGELHVLITNVAPELELAFRLWNEQEEAASDWVYPLAAGGDTSAVFPITEPGVYYLEVVDNRGDRSIQPYLLRFSMQEIDPASMVFTQTLTNTQTLTDSVSTIAAGTETITTTTTTVIITTTIRASGGISATEVITSTQTLTETRVTTDTAMPNATSTVTVVSAVTDTAPILPAPTITSTAPLTATSDITPTSTSTSTQDGSSTSPPPLSSSLTPESPAATTSLPPATASVAVIPEGELVAVEGIELVLPTGWQAAEEGGPFRGFALAPSDLTADTPRGPRLWVLAPGAADLEFSEMLEQTGDTVQLFEAATTLQVGTQIGVAVGIQETFGDEMLNRRYVFVNTEEGETYQFILEAPTVQWAEQLPLLEGILASFQAEPS